MTARAWMVLALAAGCHGDGISTVTDPSATNPSGTGPVAVDLDGILGSSHSGIPMVVESSNHVSVRMDSSAGPLHFFVDSGASVSVVSQEAASALGVPGPPLTLVQIPSLKIGDFAVSPSPIAIEDLDSTNAALRASGQDPIDGLLGAPFLAAQDAVLDYPDSLLYLTDGSPNGLAKDLGEALDGGGYDDVKATLNLAQFVTFGSTVDGSADLNSIVDSGAGASLVELAAANRLGLDLEPAATGAATIGGAHQAYQTTVGELVLGGAHAIDDRTILVVDLSAQNSQLVAAGLPPIEVLVGADLLVEQDAVLDYIGQRLWLLPN